MFIIDSEINQNSKKKLKNSIQFISIEIKHFSSNDTLNRYEDQFNEKSEWPNKPSKEIENAANIHMWNTSLAAQGALTHQLQHSTACNTSPSA